MTDTKILDENIEYYTDLISQENHKISLCMEEIKKDPSTALSIFIESMNKRLARYKIRLEILKQKKEKIQNDSVRQTKPTHFNNYLGERNG